VAANPPAASCLCVLAAAVHSACLPARHPLLSPAQPPRLRLCPRLSPPRHPHLRPALLLPRPHQAPQWMQRPHPPAPPSALCQVCCAVGALCGCVLGALEVGLVTRHPDTTVVVRVWTMQHRQQVAALRAAAPRPPLPCLPPWSPPCVLRRPRQPPPLRPSRLPPLRAAARLLLPPRPRPVCLEVCGCCGVGKGRVCRLAY
jgi:hypothetical protein